MAKQQWKTGDQVQLASGGPVMTVDKQGVSDPNTTYTKEWVVCDWFDGDSKRQTSQFDPDQLVKAD